MPATANAKMTGAGAGRAGAAPAGRSLPSQELLDDLCSRFVLNAPEEELQAFERIFFLVEQAHWFYEDNTVDQNPGLKTLTLREFASLMFQSCAALRPYISHIDDIYKDFTTYKVRVPVTGAIILDESFERCLLVKGWKAGASWSFPRGKKNKDEEDHRCAAREVWEETGFDIAGLIQLNDFVEVTMAGQRLRLYIIGGVKSDTVFEPQTRKEISEIAWHRVDELPTASNETSHNRGPTGIKYFMVWPFMADLRKWISSYHPLLPKSDAVHVGKTVWKVKANAGPGASNGPGILAAPVAPQLPLAAPPAQAPTPEALAAPLLPTPVPTAARSTITPDKHRSSRAPPGNSFRSFRIDSTKIVPLDFTPEPQGPGNKSNLAVQ